MKDITISKQFALAQLPARDKPFDLDPVRDKPWGVAPSR